MLLKVVDADGLVQTLISSGQELLLTDHSGACTGVTRELMGANLLRSGWFLQNLDATRSLFVTEGVDASAPGAFQVAPGAQFPPANFPVTVGALQIYGAAGVLFSAREWGVSV